MIDQEAEQLIDSSFFEKSVKDALYKNLSSEDLIDDFYDYFSSVLLDELSRMGDELEVVKKKFEHERATLETMMEQKRAELEQNTAQKRTEIKHIDLSAQRKLWEQHYKIADSIEKEHDASLRTLIHQTFALVT